MTKNKNNKNLVKTKVRTNSKVLKGKGDYSTVDLNSVNDLNRRLTKLETPSGLVSMALPTVGGLVGAEFGMPELGAAAGSALSKWMGYGDYTVRSNSLIKAFEGGVTGATFMKNGRADRIVHREYIGDVISSSVSGQFNVQSFAINPGIAATFPWLSSIAVNYEQYKIHGCVFEFISNSGAFNGSSQALGTVIMATDYDPTDAAFVNKIEMEIADYSNSARTLVNQVHGIECDPNERGDMVLLNRSGSVGSESLKFYDLGNFQIATVGVSGTSVNLGELWVTYDTSFYKKQFYQGQYGNTILYSNVTATTGITTSAYFGTNATKAGTLSVTFNSSTIVFPSHIQTGRYIIVYSIAGTSCNAPVFTFTTNCSATPSTWSGTTASIPFAGIAGTASSTVYYVTISGPSATITLSGGSATGATYMNCNVLQVPYATNSTYT